MPVSTAATVGLFCAMQAVAQLIFKWGSSTDGRWLAGFLGGNLFGFSSIWLLMLVYRSMNPNVALGICTGGSFLLSQLALAAVFRSGVAPLQWTGVAAIAAGVLLLSAGR